MTLLESFIGVGIQNKKTRYELMKEANLDREGFKKELAKTKETQLVFFDDGYYIPATSKEIDWFISKCNVEIGNIQRLIVLAEEKKKKIRRKS